MTPEEEGRESSPWDRHRLEQERDWARLPAAVRLRALEEMKRFAEQVLERRKRLHPALLEDADP